MGEILTGTTDYDAVRTRLGITTDDLWDAEITSIGLLKVAEAMIKVAVPTYATIMLTDTPNKAFLQAATLALCGALAVRSIEVKRGQSFAQGGGDYSESATKADWSATREELMCESKGYLLQVDTGEARAINTIFLAAGPTSSRAMWPQRIEQWYARVQPTLLNWLDSNGLIQFGWEVSP
jgi:hypothetical protein